MPIIAPMRSVSFYLLKELKKKPYKRSLQFEIPKWHTHIQYIQFFKIRFLLQTLKMFDCIWHYTFLSILGHLIVDTEAYGSGVPVSTYFTVCSEMTPRHSTAYNPSSASPNPTPYYSAMDSTPVFEISVNQSCFKAGDVLKGITL